jgi:hypothetical protein
MGRIPSVTSTTWTKDGNFLRLSNLMMLDGFEVIIYGSLPGAEIPTGVMSVLVRREVVRREDGKISIDEQPILVDPGRATYYQCRDGDAGPLTTHENVLTIRSGTGLGSSSWQP